MIDFTIETYWNVETLFYIFNAVAAMMSGAGFAGLLKIVFIFAIGIGMFSYIAGRQLEMAQWFIQALIFTTLLNLPVARVTFTDTTGVQPPRVVAHVPFAMAMVGQMVNMTFGFITRQYETAFDVPDQLGMAQGDVGFGHRILKKINHAEIQDPGLRADLLQFIKECTLYDIKDGQITPQQLIGGTNVWEAVFTNTSPARFVTYSMLSATPVTDTCQNVALILRDKVNNAVTSAQTFYGKQAFPLAQSDALATSMFMGAAGASYDWILQSSQNSSEAMRQSMFNNMWRQAGTTLPAMLHDSAQVAEVAAFAGEAQAAAQSNGSNSVLSLLGQETLPHMRNWLEAILYALFPVVVILMIVSTAEGAKKIVGGYMMSLAWIGLWPVLFAVINHLSLMYLKHKANALSLAAGVPFQLSDVFDSTLINEQAQIGYMVVLVPFIAGAIIRLGQGGFMSVADKAISGFNSNGASAGAAMAAGNINMGQAGIDTQNINTTSMHKMDYNTGLQGGGASIGTSSGGVARLANNGSAALEQMNNRFMTSMSSESNLNSQRSEEAHSTSTAGTGSATINRHSDSSSLNHITGHENTRGTNQTKGIDVSDMRQGSIGGTSDKSQSLHTSNRDSSTFHSSAGARDNLQMGINAGIGNGSSSVGAGITGKSSTTNEENRIAKTMQQTGSSQQEVDKAINGYRAANATGGGSKFGFRFGLESGKNYSADHNRNKAHEQSHTSDETTRLSTGFHQTESLVSRESDNQQSAQNNRQSIDAARSNVDEHSVLKDAINRNEYGVGNRTSHGENQSFSIRHDMLNDTEFMQQVAQRNGMSAMRFYSQETPTILKKAREYAEERGVLSSSQQLNNTTYSGENVPTTKSAIQHHADENQGKLSNDIDKKYHLKRNQTHAQSVEGISVNTSEPAIVDANKNLVRENLESKNLDSIPSRSAVFDENVEAWASHDKKVGEGRADPMAVVESIEWRDGKDTLNKSIDLITGGDGTANGEKLNANKKREDNAGF